MKKIIIPILWLTSLTFFVINAQENKKEAARKLSLTLYAIENLYVEDVDFDQLIENGIIGILKGLDPHSEYSDSTETKALTEPLDGNFDGIGIQFNMLTDTVYVIQVIPGGPSERAGMLPGDRIITVNDSIIAGLKMSTIDVMKKLRGPKGSKVVVGINRNGNKDLLKIEIKRDKIPVHSLDAAYMITPEIGYIKLNRFAQTSAKEFQEAAAKLKKQGLKKIILDLQGNGGGYLNAAVDLADEFLKSGQLITFTEGKHQKRSEALASLKGGYEDMPLIILVDDFSASASEIVSGAIQDWDRGVIVGRRTFGKGLVQRPIPLPDGSMIRLTVARYHTPSGRCIQRPYEAGNKEKYIQELNNRYERGEMVNRDSIHLEKLKEFRTLVNKRKVYEGGGIMPDFFVPLDTTKTTTLHRQLLAKAVINKVAMSMIDENRKTYEAKYKSFKDFEQRFAIDSLWDEKLKETAKTDDIEWTENEFNQAKYLIHRQLKALVARDLFDMNEYFRIMNPINDAVNAALEIFNTPNKYEKLLKKQTES